MLTNLIVRNFAIIEDIEVSFQDGLSAITGETGAGKSIIIDAISLLLGERSSFNKIRSGAKQALIEGTFYIEQDENITNINALLPDLIAEDRLLVVTRILDEAGRSRLQMNGRTTTLTTSKVIMPTLIDIHSQHQNIALLNEKKHLGFLDAFVDSTVKTKFKEAYFNYEAALKTEKHLKTTLLDETEIDFLEFQIQEIAQTNIQVGELEELEKIAEQLKNLDKIAQARLRLERLLTSDQGALTNLYLAGKEFDHLGQDYENIAQILNNAYYELDAAISQSFRKIDALFDETRSLDEVMKRTYQIRKVIKKYGHSEENTLKTYQDMAQQVKAAKLQSSRLNEAAQDVAKAKNKAQLIALELREARKITAASLEQNVNTQLADLALNNADFKVNFADAALSKTGIDEIAFYLSANIGSNYLPIKDAISGGEASRLMLALKIVFKTLGSAETLIFDEVDAGVSGRIAAVVGRKMAEVSKNVQVIAITHLAQVAAFGDQHYLVEKEVFGETTKANITLLNENQSLEALAKLLSGDTITEATLTLAQELKKEAQKA